MKGCSTTQMGGSYSRSKGEHLGELCPFSMQCSSHEQLSAPAWAGSPYLQLLTLSK